MPRRSTTTSSGARLFLLFLSMLSFGCLLASQVLFIRLPAVPVGAAPRSPRFTVVYYLVALSVNAFTRGFDLKTHQRLVRELVAGGLPVVDIFLPVCGEEPSAAQHLGLGPAAGEAIRARSLVYVLDDSRDRGMRRMALAFGFEYLRRPDRGWFKKAGNLRFAFTPTHGDFILVLTPTSPSARTC